MFSYLVLTLFRIIINHYSSTKLAWHHVTFIKWNQVESYNGCAVMTVPHKVLDLGVISTDW